MVHLSHRKTQSRGRSHSCGAVNRSANYTAQVHYSSKAKACSTKSGRLLSKDERRLFNEPAGEGFDIDEVVFVPI